MSTNYYKSITSLFLFFSFFFTVFAQENYLRGYLTLSNGDTSQGYIDYRNWAANPNRIYFKNNLNDTRKQYTPLQIKGFSVSDEQYESAIVSTEISPISANELNFEPALIFRTDTTFLQTMIQGRKSLYFYKNNLGTDQFYIKSGAKYELLIYKKYLENHNKANYVIENEQYKEQLNAYLSDCPTLSSQLTALKYEKKSMEDLLVTYYREAQLPIGFQKKTEKASTQFGVTAGGSYTALKFKSGDFPELVNANFEPSLNITGGLFFEIVTPRNRKKWSIYNELTIAAYKAKGVYEEYFNEERYNINRTQIGFTYLKLNNLVRFKQPVGKSFFFANAGISNGFALQSTNTNEVESKFYGPVTFEKVRALNEFRKYEQSALLGVGFIHKHLSAELRYELGNGMAKYTVLKSVTHKCYFLISYSF